MISPRSWKEEFYLRIGTDMEDREEDYDDQDDDKKWCRFSLVSSYGCEEALIYMMINGQFTSMFGCGKREMYELVYAFMRHGWNPPDFEAAVHRTLVVLHRFKANGTYENSSVFGLSPSSLRQTFNSTVEEWYKLFARRILDARNVWEGASKPSLEAWATAIARKGAPFFDVWGFIDGTVIEICRPTHGQRAFYNDKDRVHALKYSGIITPDGIFRAFMPGHGSAHDMGMLYESGFLRFLMQDLNRTTLMVNGVPKQYRIWGDSGYWSDRTWPALLAPLPPGFLPGLRDEEIMEINTRWPHCVLQMSGALGGGRLCSQGEGQVQQKRQLIPPRRALLFRIACQFSCAMSTPVWSPMQLLSTSTVHLHMSANLHSHLRGDIRNN
jgi:hypothetical protein